MKTAEIQSFLTILIFLNAMHILFSFRQFEKIYCLYATTCCISIADGMSQYNIATNL